MTAAVPATPSQPSPCNSLRLFDPEDSPPPAPPEPHPVWRNLRWAWLTFLKDDWIAEGKKLSTIEQYEQAISHWEHRTLDPVLLTEGSQDDPDSQERLVQVLNREARRLRDSMTLPCSELRSQKTLPHGHAANTINKTWRHLTALFRALSKPGYRNPAGKGLIDRPPHMKPVKGPRRTKTEIVPSRDIATLYRSCRGLRKLRGCKLPTGLVAQGAIVLYHFCGARTFDLVRLTNAAVTWGPRHPDPIIKLRNRWGWLSYTTEKTAEPITIPLSRIVYEHLVRLRREPHERLFPLPCSHTGFYRFWGPIFRAAGVKFLWKQLRVTCNNNWRELSTTEPHLGKFVLGHRTGDVNERYYVKQSREMLKVVARYPRLKCFRDVLQTPRPSRQLELFSQDNDRAETE